MTSPFDPASPYASARHPVFARNVVATSHPLAAQVGLRTLQQGGNAIDAAIACAAAMTVLEPCSNGLGSDAFAIIWDGQRLQGLNASGRAPAAWTPGYFRQRHGLDATRPPLRGWDAVTVPGAVAGWVALSERYGQLPLVDLLAPAADIAERGYGVPVVVQQKWSAAAKVAELVKQPGFAQTFLPHGRAPSVGERFCLPGAARALRAIGASRGAAFYQGEIAQAMVAASAAQGGAMTAADLASYQPEWVDTLHMAVRGHQLHEIPPNGQGLAALIALGLLRHHEFDHLAVDSAAAQHLQIEAMKLAFADVYHYLAEPGSMAVTAEQLLDPAYLAERARLIDPRKAQDFGAGNPVKGGTIYLTTADEAGRMVSFIQSNYMGFGSGVVLPEWGLSLQNRGHGFVLADGHANQVAPGKRPFHTIIPAFLTDAQGQPQMSFGVMGGHMQPQGHLQTLLRMLAWHQNPQAACDAPRWRFNQGLAIDAEGHWPAETLQGLQDLGHQLTAYTDSYMDFGAGQFIWRLGDPAVAGYEAASDPRRDGAAAGW